MVYKSIIDALTREEKIQLVANFFTALSDPEIAAKGVPVGKVADFNDLLGEYPSVEEMAFCWDEGLIEAVAEDAAIKARADGVKFIVTPDIKTALNPYKRGISEDPYLCGTIGAALSRAIHKAGAACILSRFSLCEDDTKYLDPFLDERAVNDFFVAPFRTAINTGSCDAVMSSLDLTKQSYPGCNVKMFDALTHNYFGKMFAISDKTSTDVDFHEFLGRAAIGGSALALDRALDRYNKLVEYLNNGTATERDFSGAVGEGTAISEETLDEAVDAIIDFAFLAGGIMPSVGDYLPSDELRRMVAERSPVLLRNENILPLKKGTKLAVIGEDGIDFGDKFEKVSEEQGYDEDKIRSENLVDAAARAVHDAEAVLVFFKREEWTDKLVLPPNRLELIDALIRTGRPLIAVITGAMPIDMTFDQRFAATLILPCTEKYCLDALVGILAGEINPSGKLPRTYYSGADRIFADIESSIKRGAGRIGPFSGYRYYDCFEKKVRYPFGYGLSYTEFAYSAVKVSRTEVSFTLRNAGKFDGAEVVQIYVGKANEPLLPIKQLKAFTRVFLRSGEIKRVTVPMPEEAFTVYDYGECDEVQRGGSYTVYVGASAEDIKFKRRIVVDGPSEVDSGNLKPSDFLIGGTNINDASRITYAIESDESSKRAFKAARNSCTAGALISAFLAVFISFFIEIGGSSTVAEILLTVFGLIALCCTVYLGVDAILARKRKTADYEIHIRDARVLDATPEEVFDKAFESEEKEEEKVFDEDAPKYIDRSIKYEKVFDDLKRLAGLRGIRISDKMLRDFIAAISVTPRLIMSTDNEGEAVRFCNLIAAYFGRDIYIDNGDTYNSADNMFRHWNYDNCTIEPSQLSCAVKDARDDPEYLHVALVCHLGISYLSALSFGGGTEDSIFADFPPNLLVIMMLGEGESLGRIPSAFAESSAAIRLTLGEGGPNVYPLIQPLGFSGFMSLRERVRSEFPLDERLWKKIDRIEEELNKSRKFNISNKIWVKLERHASTVLALGGSKEEAIDGAMASELLPRIYPVWNRSSDKDLGLTLEGLFGINDIDACKAFLETTVNNKL